jgi:hypothetical protein
MKVQEVNVKVKTLLEVVKILNNHMVLEIQVGTQQIRKDRAKKNQ